MKVPHQGSGTGSSDKLLRAIQPSVAVILVGENNPFGHPDKEVLQRLERLGVKVYRTDRHGAITFTTDAEKIRVSTIIDDG
jgi:competence protein ComEC